MMAAEAIETVDMSSSEDDNSYDSTNTSNGRSSDESAAVLGKLPSAPIAQTSRKRSFICTGKTSANGPQPKWMRTSGGISVLTPRVSTREDVLQFPGEELCVSAGKLYCNARQQTLQKKRRIVAADIATSKHRE